MPRTAMLAVTRYRVSEADAAGFLNRARTALDVLAERPGWRAGHVGRAVDDPTLWIIYTQWADVGSYRRALSSYEVKVSAVPLLAQAIDEPTAFEVLTATDSSARAADAGTVGIGQAAGPAIASDLD
ncbi:MAG TPA: antibiotic biosynthesis monooxygenase family protein [Jiangellaceae bacterium]